MERRKCIAYWPLLLLLAFSALTVGAEETAAAAENKAAAAENKDAAAENKDAAAEKDAVAEKQEAVFAKRAERSKRNFAKQDERMVKARELAAKKEYVAALKIMEDVLAELDLEKSDIDSEVARERLVMVRREARSTRHIYGQDILQEARQLAAEDKFDEAANVAGRAVKLALDVAEVPGMDHKIDADLKNEADALMTFCRNKAQAEKRRDEVSLKRAQSADYDEQQKKIRQYLGEAVTYIKTKHFEEALRSVEQVFILDPLNTQAMLLSTQIYQLIYKYGLARTKTDASIINAYSEWQWAEPVFDAKSTKGISVPDGKIKTDGGSAVDDKLKRIIFPRVNFADTSIQAVLTQLEKRSKDYDPDKEGLVINRILPQDSEMTVKLNCNDMSLGEILRYICLMTGLEYRVDGNSILVSSDAASELRTRKWSVGSQLFSDVLATDGTAAQAAAPAAGNDDNAGGDAGGADAGGGGGGEDNAAADTGKATNSNNPTPQQWYNFFTKNMINIPPGWRITSDNKAQTVTVTSNSDCLREIDEFIHLFDANQEEKLVMIEIRALEINENDAQELGFNWNLGAMGYNMDGSGTIGDKGSTGWIFGQGSNTTNGGDGGLQMIRDAATITGLANSKVLNDFNVFPALFGSQNWFGSDLPVDLRLTINALSQNRRVETLSAPKLMTLNGVEASVSVGKVYYFPTDWDDLEIEWESNDAGTGYYKITLPTPTIPEEGQELGIKLKAKPTILDNRVIRLELHPDITAYLGQDNGEGRYDIKVYGYDVTNGKAGATRLIWKFPIWRAKTSIRQLDLTVDVYDGETVVIGGIIDNSATNRTDKMPILADLPLIGRFFQSQAENSHKQNLIMFVTARIVDLYGNPMRHLKNVGVPDFNR